MRQLFAAVSAVTLGLTVGVGPAVAQEASTAQTVVASGLDNPRMLSFENGNLYVVESGRGGSDACTQTPEGPKCFGLSGAVTMVGADGQSRIISGLPSLAGPGGASASGPADVAMQGGRHFTISVGLGMSPSRRAGLPGQAAVMGTVLAGTLPSAQTRVIGDLAAFEATDPDASGPDSNPVAITTWQGRNVAVDAGGNSVVWVGPGKKVSLIATLPTSLADAPPFLGLPPGTKVPAQAVPTSAAVGPDGALYVSQLTGFPFPKGGSSIFRIAPGGQPTVWAGGLTNVTDLAWYHGKLYAVQLADDGLLAAGDKPPEGSLVQVDQGMRARTVAAGLLAPYGVALRQGHAYVSTCSVCAGDGQVVKIALGGH